ncbi:MAG: response regulator transcription factor [Alphaproteobacteria bacterium]|nr:MAG: response regulator transcription factor [Alphaproteobacteria bacterium]
MRTLAATEMATLAEAGREMGTETDRGIDAPTPTRIAFVDDHPMLLRGIVGLFEDNRQFEVVGTAQTSVEAIALAGRERPDVLTLDLSMPGDVFSAIRVMSERLPTLRIVIFTAYDDVAMAVRAIDAGAHAFVLKGRPSDDLFEAIAAVQDGEFFVSPPFAQKLAAGTEGRAACLHAPQGPALSQREVEIVDLLMKGRSNKEIARELGLTEKTIKHYMTNLMTKLKVRNRLEVVIAMQSGTGVGIGALRQPGQPGTWP